MLLVLTVVEVRSTGKRSLFFTVSVQLLTYIFQHLPRERSVILLRKKMGLSLFWQEYIRLPTQVTAFRIVLKIFRHTKMFPSDR